MIQHTMCTGGHIVSEYTGYTITRFKLIMQVLDQKDFKGFLKVLDMMYKNHLSFYNFYL